MEPFDGTLDAISYWHAQDRLPTSSEKRSEQSAEPR